MDTARMMIAARLEERSRRYRRLLGQYINHLGIERGMSQDDLARESGLSRTGIHNIEHGLTSEKMITMKHVCDALKISYGELVAHMDYVMDHPECEPVQKGLKTRRGK